MPPPAAPSKIGSPSTSARPRRNIWTAITTNAGNWIRVRPEAAPSETTGQTGDVNSGKLSKTKLSRRLHLRLFVGSVVGFTRLPSVQFRTVPIQITSHPVKHARAHIG